MSTTPAVIRRRFTTRAGLGVSLVLALATQRYVLPPIPSPPPMPSVPMTFEPGITAPLLGTTTDPRRFHLTENGFERIADATERVVSHPGAPEGSLVQPAGTYTAMPLDDVDQPNGSGDPVFFTKNVGTDTITYPGDHTDADIFGTTGKGVLITQGASGTGNFNASNIKATGLVAGDIIRAHGLVCITASAGGTIGLRLSGGALNVSFNYTHDADGKITGFTEAWGTWRAGFYNFPFLINGKQWVYLWADRAVTATADVNVGFQFINTVAGRKLHVCTMAVQKNPTDFAAAVPVTQSGTYAADQVLTGITSQVGYVLHGLQAARSIAPSGVITAPALECGVPYLPIVTRIEVLHSTELADKSGILANENLLYHSTPWLNPANFTRWYGPTRIQRNWLISASSKGCGNAVIGSVFQRRKDKRAILGRISLSRVHLTGSVTVDGTILLAQSDSRVTTMYQQNDNRSSGASTFDFHVGPGYLGRDCLVMGHTLDTTRARYQIQQDRSWDYQVYVGEWMPQVSGGVIDDSGSRYQYLSRRNPGGANSATNWALVSDDVMALDMWSDPLIYGAGTYTINRSRNFFGHTTSYGDLYMAQSQRQIQVSFDEGATWENFRDTGLEISDLPHGVTAEYVGTFNPATGTVSYGSAPNKGPLKFRYYENGNLTGFVNRIGFQIHMSQMDMGDHTRYPSDRDVFRTGVETGPSGISMMLEHCYQSGRWSTDTVWSNIGDGNPTQAATGTHPDFAQMTRFEATVTSATMIGNVYIGKAQGEFLTGASSMPSNGSVLDGFNISDWVFFGEAIRALTWDWSRATPARLSVPSAIIIQGEQEKPFRFATGGAGSVQLLTAGPNNVMTFGGNVVIATSGGSFGGTAAGATIVGSPTRLPLSVVSGFTNYTPAANLLALDLVPGIWHKTGNRIRLPQSSAEALSFRLSAGVMMRPGVTANSVIEAALGNHDEWDPIVTDLRDKYLGAPDRLIEVPNNVAVGTVLATGLTGTGFAEAYGGNEVDGLFAIVGGELRVARALTGLNRIDLLLTNADETLVVDMRPAAAPSIAGARILGTPQNGETLRVRFVARGLPAPGAASLQWQRNGTNIAGQTGETITLNQAAMGLANGDTISCEISVTSAAGTATAEPTRSYQAASVPAITASSISGQPFDGQTLTASATVTGVPTPAVTYQWQRNGTNIAGQTAATITLNAGAMGLVAGDTISCEISVTNASGSATAEPTIAFVNVLTALIAALNGEGVSSVHALADAIPGATLRSDDKTTNNNDLTQSTASAQPAIGTGGATFDNGDWLGQTIAGQTLTIVMSFTKADASTTGAFLADQASNSLAQYQEGSANAASLTGSVTINGTVSTSRGTSYAALHTTGKRVITVAGLSMAGDTQLRLGRGGGSSMVGVLDKVVVLDEAALGTDLAAARALAEAWVAT